MSRAEEFEQLRPLLFSIAYRILGSVAEAEDAVQETWLRYEASPTHPTSAKAFLSAAVTRISIDVLRSARVRREEYVGQWFPEPLLTDPYQDPERSAELADSVSMAALLLLERLSPLERAVFVLREVFGFGFDGDRAGGRPVGGGVPPARGAGAAPHGRGAPPVRGGPPGAGGTGGAVLRRAPGRRRRRPAGAARRRRSAGRRTAAARPRSWPGAVVGADKVARVLASVFPWLVRIDVTLEPHEVNGQPGAIFRDRDGKVLYTLALDVLDGQIQTIRSVINPDKLRHVGPVADAWAVAREVNQARRPTD